MKEEYIQIAKETFRGYNRKITADGHRPLGVVVGSNKNKEVEEVRRSVRMSKTAGNSNQIRMY